MVSLYSLEKLPLASVVKDRLIVTTVSIVSSVVQLNGAGSTAPGVGHHRAHGDGDGIVNDVWGSVEGEREADATGVVGDANVIVEGGRVKLQRVHRRVAAQHEGVDDGVFGERDDVDDWRDAVEGEEITSTSCLITVYWPGVVPRGGAG